MRQLYIFYDQANIVTHFRCCQFRTVEHTHCTTAMEFDKIHFKLNKWLQPVHKLPLGHVSVIKQATPEPLYVLCSHVCDDLPLPEAFKWNNMHVLQWIERLGFPQYRVQLFVVYFPRL